VTIRLSKWEQDAMANEQRRLTPFKKLSKSKLAALAHLRWSILRAKKGGNHGQ